MKVSHVSAARLLAIVAGSLAVRGAVAQTVFYSEGFDAAAINQPSGDPAVAAACIGSALVFTHVPPAGWIWDASGVPTFGTPCGAAGNGVREWEGWSFANKDLWVTIAGDQNRSLFTKGIGNVAVADPDEWDDRGAPVTDCGFYNAFMTTPAINISAADPGSISFTLDSSWRPEGFDDGDGTNNQTATIHAIYTVGGIDQPAVEVLHWDSDTLNLAPGDFFHADSENETVSLSQTQLQVPVGATAVKFKFGLTEAGNDWWWAVDNLALNATVSGTPSVIYSEGFEGVTLLPPVDETGSGGCSATYCGLNTYTHTAPNGALVTVASPVSGGVSDWRGWSFVNRAFWNCTSGGNGSSFTNGSGIIAVADGDEFDDLPHAVGDLDTLFSTPAIGIGGRSGNLLVLSFDSSWRFEDSQAVYITAEYNVGGTVEVLRWESTPGLHFKGDAPNERVVVPLNVPAGATSVTLKFRYVGADDWWWAIDNVSVFEGQATVNAASLTPSQGSMILAPSVNYAFCSTPWSPTPPTGWSELWNPIGSCPVECGRPEWRGWSFASKDWWWQQVDNQNRDKFLGASGIVAIADNDEWDDFANGQTNFNAFMTTPAIALPGAIASANLTFNSSWRPESFDDTCSCDPNPAASTIVSMSVGNPTVVTTAAPHGFVTGNYVTISASNATPTLNGRVRVAVTGPNTFTIPAQVTVAGTLGTATRRPTNNQTAMVNAIYTVGGVDQSPVNVLKWDSDGGRAASGEQIFVPPSEFFHNDDAGHWNEVVSLSDTQLDIPLGATAVKFEFSLTNSRNDWWWALDNINLNVNGSTSFNETFENVPDLTSPPSENPPVQQCQYFSDVASQGGDLTVDNSGLVGCSSGSDFGGFNAWLVDAWARSQGGLRSQYGATTAYISDHAAGNCDGVTVLSTPAYNIASLNANSLALSFRSGWLSQPGHLSMIEVSYDNGPWSTVLSWNTLNKSTTTDEMVTIPLSNSAIANEVRIRFSDAESGWWALSNLNLTGVVGVAACPADIDDDGNALNGLHPDGGVDINDLLAFLTAFENGSIGADLDNDGDPAASVPDGGVDINDLLFFLARFEGGC
jgi:hypothetical protein